jgi:hypothetical protein
VSFCTPLDVSDEFILIENAYGVFEGPSNYQGWTNWHVFAPINPRLLVVMRQNILESYAGLLEEIGTILTFLQEQKVEQVCALYEDSLGARSCLEHLPLESAETSYETVQNAGAIKADATCCLRDTDVFTFKVSILRTEDVQLINSVFLEEAVGTRAIVFKTNLALQRAVEGYLKLDVPGFKIVEQVPQYRGTLVFLGPDGPRINQGHQVVNREEYLKFLETVAQDLGSSAKAKYEIRNAKVVEILPPLPLNFLNLYSALGKLSWSELVRRSLTEAGGDLRNPYALLQDFDQANRIATLRTRTDAAVHCPDERLKNMMQQHRHDLIARLPLRRVWLYLRPLRVMSRLGLSYNSRRRDLTRLIVADHSGVPENGLVMGKSFFTLTKMRLIIRPAYRVFRPADFGQILIDAFEASISLSRRIDPLRALTAHQIRLEFSQR